MHDAHRALSELELILLHGAGRDHVLDELNPRLSKLRLTAYYVATHLDRFYDHLCDNELRLLCVVQPFAVLLGDHHHGTNGRYLGDHFLDDRDLLADDRDPLEDDPLNHHGYKTDAHHDHFLDDRDLLEDDLLNHHGYKTDDHRDLPMDDHDLGHHFARMQDALLDDHLDELVARHDLLTDDRDLVEDDPLNHHGYKTSAHRDHRDLRDHQIDDRDLLEDDPLNHHGYKTDGHRGHRDLLMDDRDLLEDDPLNHHGYKTGDHRDHRDLLTDDHDLGHHFVRMQDDLLDDYLDGMGVRHDLMPRGRDYLLDDPDCPKDGRYLDDHGLRLVCLNDHLHRRDGLDAMVCRILLPVADDVDRDFLGLALDEVYLQTTRKRRTYAICD